MVLAVQQEEVTTDHGFKRVSSPAGAYVIAHSMPTGPYEGVSSKLSGSLFRLFFKGLRDFHSFDYTQKNTLARLNTEQQYTYRVFPMKKKFFL